MRGIILAGGHGTRLGELTRSINKHVLPVGKLPMIHYPYRTLMENGIGDITVVSTPRGVGQIAEVLGSGMGMSRCNYVVQDCASGASGALRCAQPATCHEDDYIAVILGDNIFLPPAPFIPFIEPTQGATCYLAKVNDVNKLREFGVPVFAGENILTIEEKPQNPKSHFAVTGLYVFDASIWDRLREQKPGSRGELEITDILSQYAAQGPGMLGYEEVKGFWGDAGTPEGLLECSNQAMKLSGR